MSNEISNIFDKIQAKKSLKDPICYRFAADNALSYYRCLPVVNQRCLTITCIDPEPSTLKKKWHPPGNWPGGKAKKNIRVNINNRVVRQLFAIMTLVSFSCWTSWAYSLPHPLPFVDSLLALVRQDKITDTSQVNACYELAKHYLYDSTEKAQGFASRGIDMASRLRFDFGKGHCLNILAMSNELLGHLEDALNLYEEAFATLSDAGAEDDAAGVLVNMGVAYYYSGNRGESLKYYLRALEYARENNLMEQESKLLNNIGVVYRELKQYEQAIAIYEKSLRIKLELNDSLGYATTLENLGLAYSYRNDAKNATYYLHEAIGWYHKLGDISSADQAQLSLGSIYVQLGKWKEAETVLVELLKGQQVRLLPHYMASCYLMLARISLHKKDNQQALYLLNQGFELIENSNRDELKVRYLTLYADIYKEMEDFKKALIFTDRRISIMDTLNQLDRIEKEREMKAKFDLQEKEAQLLIQDQKIMQKNRESQWFGAILIISLLLLIVITIFALSKVQTNRTLMEKNRIIDQSLREKEVLLKEIHHRVKNNLQVVSSLLSLQAKSLKGEEALDALAKGKDRVRSMALIHQNLYQEEHLTGVNSREYVDRLCKALLNSYSMHGADINIKTEVEPMLLDVDTVIPIGLIINELITNAIKYAFIPHQSGEILISLKRNRRTLELVVADNGIGMKENSTPSQTMGYRLIKAFVQKLKGTYQVTIDQGTRVAFQFRSFGIIQPLCPELEC